MEEAPLRERYFSLFLLFFSTVAAGLSSQQIATTNSGSNTQRPFLFSCTFFVVPSCENLVRKVHMLLKKEPLATLNE